MYIIIKYYYITILNMWLEGILTTSLIFLQTFTLSLFNIEKENFVEKKHDYGINIIITNKENWEKVFSSTAISKEELDKSECINVFDIEKQIEKNFCKKDFIIDFYE